MRRYTDRFIDWWLRQNFWHYLWVVVLVSIVLTELVVAAMSRLLLGRVDGGYIFTALVTACLVSLAVGAVVLILSERVRKNEERYRLVVKHAGVPVMLLGLADENIHFANAMAAECLGSPTRDLVGRPIADFWVRPAQWQDCLALVVRDGHVGNFEAELRAPDGGSRWVSLSANRVDFGGVPTIFAMFYDVTDRVRAEQEIHNLNQALEGRVLERTRELYATEAKLREAVSLNQNILTSSAVGIAVYRQDGQCVVANPSFSRTIGGSEAQLLAQNFRHLKSWQESGLLSAAERVLASGVSQEVEIEITTSFGKHLWVDCQLSRFTSQGEGHLLLMAHDVSEAREAKEALQARERNFRTLADNVPDNIIRYDCEGRVLYLNRTLEATLGRSAEELIGTTAVGSDPAGRFDALHQAVRRVGTTGEAMDVEQVLEGPDGEPRYHAIRLVAERDGEGRLATVLAVGRDLTRQRSAEEQLRLAASVFHNSAEGVLVTDATGIIVSVNPAFTEITGYTSEEAVGQKPSLLRSDRQGPEFYRAMWSELTADGRWQGEIWNRRKGGEAYLEWLTINRIDDDSGRPVRYVSVFHDITELRQKDERIRHLAFHDALTGLPNRALMQDRLQHALERARREGRGLSVIFIDLDRFKAINDGLGHDVGDLLLQEVACRLKNRIRSMDTVARLGGDEFVVLMEDLEAASDCACLAEELLAEISRPMELRGHTVEIGASMGMAFFPEDGTEALDLMKRADMAMYAAKGVGHNTYRFFRPDMRERASERLAVEMDLRRAVANRELELHYQPRVSLADGRAVGVEALVRWRHPARGLVPPGEFIPLAEETGIIDEIGAWVRREACRQAADWQSRGLALPIAVNVSAHELDGSDLAAGIGELAAQYGIEPSMLEIELTESAVMADPESVAGLFGRLRAMGVSVAVDDFGTGYSSLAYLRRLPIDVLKIDRSFVKDADRDADNEEIVKTILGLGRSLKLSVVAEGIESESQARLIRSHGGEIAQGFLYSRPLPARELEAWLSARGAETGAATAGSCPD